VKVGFDAHMVGQRETGNETYALGLLRGLEEIGFAVDAYSLSPLQTLSHRRHKIWPRNSLTRIPVSTPILAVRDHLDLYHATYVLPPVLPCPAVVTVHDISFSLHPEWFPGRVSRMLNILVPRAMRQASRIITLSESGKRDIVERYNTNPEKVDVTYLAPRPAFSTLMRAKGADDPFLLFVGNVQPRKNIETIIQAVNLLAKDGRALPLIVAGRLSNESAHVVRLVRQLGLERLIRFLDYVPDQHLLELYASATALVHPAFYEGFGLTLVEAMVQGTPVLAANTSAIPEVVGEAGLLIDPSDPVAWADAIARVAGDRPLRDRLSAQSVNRSRSFSWARCAQDTVGSYQMALRTSRQKGGGS
jgi:glycosyltransferase involved in cell wall biosynthesis